MNRRMRLFTTGPAAAAVAICCAAQPAYAQGTRLTLQDAVRLSLDFHPRLGAARAARDGAAAALSEARADRLPNATAEAAATRFQEPMIVAPLHEFSLGTAPEFNRTLIQGRLTVGYLLFDGGRRHAGIGQAQATDMSAAAAVTSARMSVIEGVTQGYLRVLTAIGVDEANRRRVSALDAERRRVEQLLSEGRAARVELLRVAAALAASRADLVAAEADLEVATNNLARVMGVDRETVAATQLVDVIVGRSPIAPDVATALLIANPDIEQMRQRAHAFRAAYRGARAGWFPTVRLVGGILTFGDIQGNFFAEWQGGLVVSYPLFTGGTRTNSIARAAATVAQAEEELRLLELQIQEAGDRAVASHREGRARVAALTTAVEHFTEVARIERLSLSAGLGVQTDYLAAEANLFRARADLVRARHTEIAARVNLARMTGELTVTWLAAYLENKS